MNRRRFFTFLASAPVAVATGAAAAKGPYTAGLYDYRIDAKGSVSAAELAELLRVKTERFRQELEKVQRPMLAGEHGPQLMCGKWVTRTEDGRVIVGPPEFYWQNA